MKPDVLPSASSDRETLAQRQKAHNPAALIDELARKIDNRRRAQLYEVLAANPRGIALVDGGPFARPADQF